jgi:hypothetical protein
LGKKRNTISKTLLIHSFVLPYYKKAFVELQYPKEYNDFCFKLNEDKIFFPLKGIRNNFSDKFVVFDEVNNFVKAIGIDFLLFDDSNKYINFVFHNSLISSDKRDLVIILKAWYEVSKLASLNFFNTTGALASYFQISNSVSKWWTKERTDSKTHKKYEKRLVEIVHQDKFSLENVLEIGSGFGRIQRLYKNTKNLIQSDASHDMLCMVKDNWNLNSKRIVCDVNHLPFQQMEFDFIAMIQIAMHLNKPFELIKKLTSNYLTDHGRLLVDFTCFSNLSTNYSWIQKSPLTRIYSANYLDSRIFQLNLEVLRKDVFLESKNTFWRTYLLMKGKNV